MQQFQPATLLRLHICERDEYRGKPLHKCIVERCRELHMTRVTAVRGFEGYGGDSDVHRGRSLRHNLPVVIIVIDAPDKISRLLPIVEEMMETGLIAMSPVEMLALNRRARTQAVS